MVPAGRALPTPVSSVRLALEAHQGQVGYRGRQIQLEFRLGPPEVAGLPDAQLHQPGQPVFHHHPPLPVLVVAGALLQLPGLLQQGLLRMDQHPPSFPAFSRDALGPQWTYPANHPEYQGFGRPRKPKLRDGQRRTMEQRSAELPDEAWREITVAQGSQGPRTYRFSAQRVGATKQGKPGEEIWALYRRNLDGSEPRYYLSNAPVDTTVETLAYVGGSRWRIETEFQTEKGDVGLDEYETRSWAGWQHHIAMCLLGGAFLLNLQQEWGGKDAPNHPSAGVPGGA